MKRLLLLGGIGEALALARRLGPAHLYSLAGLGKVPGDLACRVRVGGYGGARSRRTSTGPCAACKASRPRRAPR